MDMIKFTIFCACCQWVAAMDAGTSEGSICKVGQPLTDDEDVRLFCGRGPGRVECPEDSYCEIHETDRYAVCCPDPEKVEPEGPICKVGQPLTDDEDVRLFCGLGPGRVECPEDSYCEIHETDRYAVCCPDPEKVEPDEGCWFCQKGSHCNDCKCYNDNGDNGGKYCTEGCDYGYHGVFCDEECGEYEDCSKKCHGVECIATVSTAPTMHTGILLALTSALLSMIF